MLQPLHFLLMVTLTGVLILILLACRDALRIARDLRRANDTDGFDQSARRFGYVNEKRGQ
jgi:hypothetical protein